MKTRRIGSKNNTPAKQPFMFLSRCFLSLTSYISRLRRQEHAGRRVEAPPLDFVRAETRREPVLAVKPTRPLAANSPHTNRLPLPPEDPLAQAMRAVSTPALDIRRIHNDGDPSGRKLV
jgi:hypothetical protein